MLSFSHSAKMSKSLSLKMKLVLTIDTIKKVVFFTHFKTLYVLFLEATPQILAARMLFSSQKIIDAGTYSDYLVQAPPQSVSRSTRFSRALLSWVLKISKARDVPTSLGPPPTFECPHGEDIFPCT